MISLPVSILSKTEFSSPCFLSNSENFNKTFEDICYETAQLLINLNKPISIFWSGGIDSTCLLATFMKLVSDPKQIRVVMTPKSIEEYPWFYEEKIKGHYDILMYHNYIHRYDPRQSVAGGHFAGDEIILTGSFGDQLFGSIKVVNNLDIKVDFTDEDSPIEDDNISINDRS